MNQFMGKIGDYSIYTTERDGLEGYSIRDDHNHEFAFADSWAGAQRWCRSHSADFEPIEKQS